MTDVAEQQTAAPPDGSAPSFDDLRRAVDARLQRFLSREAARWCRVDADLAHGYDLLARFIANGGKRLRPAFAFWAYIGAGGDADDHRIVDLAAALELLHTFALVHDDVMDGSQTRRHAPTVHRSLIDTHRTNRWHGESRRFGEGVAILLGDLALVYADTLAAPLPTAVRTCFQEMKVELHVGQYLDVWGAASGEQRPARTAAIVRHKTALYSVERPLRLGATLAAAVEPHTRAASITEPHPTRLRALSQFGLAVGEAFQLRDDLLGAFGDPALTGKPVGDDLREGKQTLLVQLARAWSRTDEASDRDRRTLDRLGATDLDDDDVAALRDLLLVSGACDRVERRIAELTGAALAALPAARLRTHAEAALAELGRRAAWRAA